MKAKIGFLPTNQRSSAAFPEPRRLRDTRHLPLSRRAVQACPSVNSFERRTIEALAPFDLGLALRQEAGGDVSLHLVPEWTRIDSDLAGAFVSLMPRHTWRSEDNPVVQIAYPYYFVSDVECKLIQTAAWSSSTQPDIPGSVIGGRYPVRVWPRSLNLAFEWRRKETPFRMKRGDALFQLYAEIPDSFDGISLVRAVETPDLARYRSSIEDVVKVTSGSEKLFLEMASRRPAVLVMEQCD